MPASLPPRPLICACARALVGCAVACVSLWGSSASAQDPPPWSRSPPPRYEDGSTSPPAARPNDAYSPRYGSPPPGGAPAGDAYRGGYAQPGPPGSAAPPYGQPYPNYAGPPPNQGYGPPYGAPPPGQGYGQPYTPAPGGYEDPAERGYGGPPNDQRAYDDGPPGSYSSREIMATGHSFFGSVSKGLANVVEYAFKNQGRPNGYILGQEASGAFVAGLRYGEGVLYTRDAGTHRVYWQGPSIGYDAGAEGSKVMMLVYNLRDPGDMYQRFGGVDGSAYFVGGVGITFQKSGEIVVAPIRSGVGLRLGANVGYLKYTPRPTWNPF
jgi:hypothetical protein